MLGEQRQLAVSENEEILEVDVKQNVIFSFPGILQGLIGEISEHRPVTGEPVFLLHLRTMI